MFRFFERQIPIYQTVVVHNTPPSVLFNEGRFHIPEISTKGKREALFVILRQRRKQSIISEVNETSIGKGDNYDSTGALE